MVRDSRRVNCDDVEQRKRVHIRWTISRETVARVEAAAAKRGDSASSTAEDLMILALNQLSL